METVLDIRNLNKKYGPLEILKDINISLEPGGFLVMVGPSGCGKSTLLNCIAGLEPISGGAIYIGGQDMTHVTPKDRNIAMVFQSYALYPTMSVAKNITFGLRVRGVDRATCKAKLDEVARQLHIEPLLNMRPAKLSGGQRQRVAMGRALVRNPRLFLFDEPLSNLDAKLRVEMRTEIKRLHQNLNASMIYVTHDQIEAMTLATKIVILQGGVIQQVGTPYEVYNCPRNLFVAGFMGSPAMNLIPAKTFADETGTRIRIELENNRMLELYDKTDAKLPEQVILGLRPEDIVEAGTVTGGKMQTADCLVDVVEPAGADTFVVSRMGGKKITARFQGETGAVPGALSTFAFNLEKASYFCPDSGWRLT